MKASSSIAGTTSTDWNVPRMLDLKNFNQLFGWQSYYSNTTLVVNKALWVRVKNWWQTTSAQSLPTVFWEISFYVMGSKSSSCIKLAAYKQSLFALYRVPLVPLITTYLHRSFHFNDRIHFAHIKSHLDDLVNVHVKIWKRWLKCISKDDTLPSEGVRQPAECFFAAINGERFRLSSSALNPQPAMTFRIMRSQCFAINIDIPYQHPISENKLLKTCWIILTELFLNTHCLQKWML